MDINMSDKMARMVSIETIASDIDTRLSLIRKLQQEGFTSAGTVNATRDGVVEILHH